MTSHPFDEAMALRACGDHLYTGTTHPAYAGFVGPFGGVTAAAALRAVLVHPLRKGRPISMTLNYAAAIAEGTFVIEAKPARTNRSTQHWTLAVRQGDATVAVGVALFGTRRNTWSRSELVPPQAAAAESVPRADDSGREPCVERYEMRFLEGAFPTKWDGCDTGSSRTCMWVRDNPPRPLDYCSLAAVSDAFFPRIWCRRRDKVPVGTMTMTLIFHASIEELRAHGDDHLLAEARSRGFNQGYSDQTAHLWGSDRRLLLTHHQVAYYRS